MKKTPYQLAMLRAALICLLGVILLGWVLVGSAHAQEPPSMRGPVTAIILGNALDAVSTEIALQRTGLREANPILGQSMPRRLVVKAAGTAAQAWIVAKLGKQQPRVAKVVGYSIGVFSGGVSIWNFSR